MSTLKASALGLARIQQRRKEKGWGWNVDDDTCLLMASRWLEPDREWHSGGPYAYGISAGTWKRFLAGKYAIGANAFKAYCQALDLNWQDVVERHLQPLQLAPQQDWDESIDTSIFYGRLTELNQLQQWFSRDHCRLVVLSGMGGIGKTTLSAKLSEYLQNDFSDILRRSLRQAPPANRLLAELNSVLAGEASRDASEDSLDQQITRLLDLLRQRRCLVILDDLEMVLCSGELAGQYRAGCEGYGELLRRLGSERHQSCLLVIARERPSDLASLAGDNLPIRMLKLGGLERDDARRILEAKGIADARHGAIELIQLYRGHPLALKIVATTIQEIFGGDVREFLDQSTLVLGDIMPAIFYQQFERLSKLERAVVYWLALAYEPVTLHQLRRGLSFSVPSTSRIVAALESLKRRSLLETPPDPVGETRLFALQPAFTKYIANILVEQFYQEIETLLATGSARHISLLRSHAFAPLSNDAPARPVLLALRDKLYTTTSAPQNFRENLQVAIAELQQRSAKEIGYAHTNLEHLLGATASPFP